MPFTGRLREERPFRASNAEQRRTAVVSENRAGLGEKLHLVRINSQGRV